MAAESVPCDVCGNPVARLEGFLLTTIQIVGSPGYWRKYYELHKNDFLARGVTAFGDFVDHPELRDCCSQAVAEQPTPWLVCAECIGSFRVDVDEVRAFARDWWDGGQKFEPPGNGPAQLSMVKMTDAELGGKPKSAVFPKVAMPPAHEPAHGHGQPPLSSLSLRPTDKQVFEVSPASTTEMYGLAEKQQADAEDIHDDAAQASNESSASGHDSTKSQAGKKLALHCPACGKALHLPKNLLGKKVMCKPCGCQLRIWPLDKSDQALASLAKFVVKKGLQPARSILANCARCAHAVEVAEAVAGQATNLELRHPEGGPWISNDGSCPSCRSKLVVFRLENRQ